MNLDSCNVKIIHNSLPFILHKEKNSKLIMKEQARYNFKIKIIKTTIEWMKT